MLPRGPSIYVTLKVPFYDKFTLPTVCLQSVIELFPRYGKTSSLTFLPTQLNRKHAVKHGILEISPLWSNKGH